MTGWGGGGGGGGGSTADVWVLSSAEDVSVRSICCICSGVSCATSAASTASVGASCPRVDVKAVGWPCGRSCVPNGECEA